MKKAVLVTVRLKSTRLKKKVLLNVEGRPVLKYLTDRLKANFDGYIILCTSTHKSDDPIEIFAKEQKILCFRGSEEDVLDRYYKACKKFLIDKIYIIYGDEPFTDIDTMNQNFNLLDESIPMWIKNDSLPEGTYGYGMTFKGLEYINNKKLLNNLEVWQLMASKMRLKKIELKTEMKQHYSNYRFTIDYAEDLEFVKKVTHRIQKNPILTEHIIELLKKNPEIVKINKKYNHESMEN